MQACCHRAAREERLDYVPGMTYEPKTSLI